LLVAFVAAVSATTSWDQLDNYSFAQYVREFHKKYSSFNEYTQRKRFFEDKLTEIKAHNDKTKSWKIGVNKFTDRTKEELKQLLGYDKSLGFHYHSQRKAQVPFAQQPLSSLPPTVDWRTKGIITPVKDQGGCGSCWTFGTTESIESFWALAKGTLPVLSEQQSVDCTPNPNDCGGTGGCGGGTAELIYNQLLKTGGVTSEANYPYVGSDETCYFNNSTPIVAKISGYVALPSNQYGPVMQAVATQGPLVINVDASSWFGYASGVYDGCNNQNPDIDHVVQLVGYGTDSSYGDYWLIRNSWGADWGENGYIRLKRDSSNQPCGTDTSPQDGTGCNGGPPTVQVCGECGILYDVTYPTI